MKLCLNQFNVYMSTIQSILTSIAIIFGGIWAIWKLFFLRGLAWGLNIKTNLSSIHKADKDYNWIIINVSLNNIGKRRLYLGKLKYSCYEIRENSQELVFNNNNNWLSILENEKGPDLYIEPNESLNRVLYMLIKKERINLILKILFEDNPKISPYKLTKKNEHIWSDYLFIRNVL